MSKYIKINEDDFKDFKWEVDVKPLSLEEKCLCDICVFRRYDEAMSIRTLLANPSPIE